MAAENGHLSRQADVYATPGNRNPLLCILDDQWHPVSNPNGFLSIGVAENTLMQEELLHYVNNQDIMLDAHGLSYGDSFSGSRRLRGAMASFITRHFRPARPLLAPHIAITSGVGPGVEALSFTLCNPGNGILLGRPFYRGFPASMSSRACASTVPVTFGEIDPFSMDAIAMYEKAVLDSKSRGLTIKAIMLCNPHNPIGRCYPRAVLEGYMRFCQKYRIHLISDEIYGLSVWDNPESPDESGFHSALSIDPQGLIDSELVHVLWGIAKDFGSNGVRLGCIISQQNQRLHAALENIAYFSCPSSLADRMTATLLLDTNFTDHYIKTNRTRLSERRASVVQFLKDHGIPYEKRSCAAFFVWADLFSFFRPRIGSGAGVCKTQEESWALEARLQEMFMQHKLFTAAGSTFSHPQPGWFRLTFAIEKDVLDEGFRRMITALRAFGKEFGY